MAESVQLIDPKKIQPNKENPRLIFREDELNSLEKSIGEQGILVPLTIFADGAHFKILDGERRWRCSIKLGLTRVPAIIQPKPDRLQNIMMMFAIHKARRDWDPLPTARKLKELEDVLTKRHRKPPTEGQLAAAASISKGEVRRYRRILDLPQEYQDELMEELLKPRHEQKLKVDHVLEAWRGVEALQKRGVLNKIESEKLTHAIVEKFKNEKIANTVEPRLLPKIARAVERGEVTIHHAKTSVMKIAKLPSYTIANAFRETAELAEAEHALEQSTERLIQKLEEYVSADGEVGEKLLSLLKSLASQIKKLV